MGRLFFDPTRCVRSSSKVSECSGCADVCPTDAIVLPERMPVYVTAQCVECGGCVGACPTEAFRLAGFGEEAALEGLAASGDVLSCKRNLPCGAALHPELLAALVLERGGDVTIDTGHCAGCSIASTLFPAIGKNAASANEFLEKAGYSRRVRTEELALEPEEKEVSRRGFLSNFGKEGLKKAGQVAGEIEAKIDDDAHEADFGGFRPRKAGEKIIPGYRMLFLNTVKGHLPATPPSGQADGSLLDFISDKRITDACTNCALCYNLCPTGALSSADERRQILFGKLLCVNCGLCHDVCPEEGALEKKEAIPLEGLFEGKREELARFKIRSCMECGTPFTYDGQNFCLRCRTLEEDAKELNGM